MEACDIEVRIGDALLLVDIQNDFLPGGSLQVPGSDAVLPVVNRYIDLFESKALPVFATRDWHPEGHMSFKESGGPWPAHCVQGRRGAEFPKTLRLPESCVVISTATEREKEAYSGFEGTDLDDRLRVAGIKRVFVAGLATDYCVLATVMDARKKGFVTFLLEDGTRAVNVRENDGEEAVKKMVGLGAVPIDLNHVC
jgi:nicotinamidase/pyrazinamidase